MKSRHIRFLLAGVVALGVNALLFFAMSLVNRVDPASPRTLSPEKVVVLRAQLETPPPPPQPKPLPPKPRMQVVELNLDLPTPTPQPLPVTPVPLKLLPPSLPSASAVVLAASRQPSPPTVDASQSSPAPPAPNPPPAGPLSSEAIDQPARGLSVRDPKYPRAALERGQEGSVTIEMLIDQHGRVESIRVLASRGPDAFVDAVRAAASDWRFSPPRHRGQPVKVRATKTVQFKIEGR